MTTVPGDRLLELQQRFLVGLERRTNDLTTTLTGSADSESLMQGFHSLVGLGGTYGFPRITEVSRTCEALCVKAIKRRRALSSVEQEKLMRAVIEIVLRVAPL